MFVGALFPRVPRCYLSDTADWQAHFLGLRVQKTISRLTLITSQPSLANSAHFATSYWVFSSPLESEANVPSPGWCTPLELKSSRLPSLFPSFRRSALKSSSQHRHSTARGLRVGLRFSSNKPNMPTMVQRGENHGARGLFLFQLSGQDPLLPEEERGPRVRKPSSLLALLGRTMCGRQPARP